MTRDNIYFYSSMSIDTEILGYTSVSFILIFSCDDNHAYGVFFFSFKTTIQHVRVMLIYN